MPNQSCKVCRVLEERGMGQYEDQLLEYWLADSHQRKGYRQLADWLNVVMLRREMDRTGLSTLGDEAESKYERLRADNAIAAEVRESLRTEGVPIDDLEDDFVSYGVIRTHIKDCLDAERTHESSDWEINSIEIARNHARMKITEAVRSLETKGKVTAVGNIDIHVEVELECDETYARVPINRAIRRGYISKGDLA